MIKENKIFLYLLLTLSVLSAFNIYLPQGSELPINDLPASKEVISIATFFIIILLYGVLGFIGIKISKKIEIPNIRIENKSIKKTIYFPSVVGFFLVIFFILVDIIFSDFNSFGNLHHPPFPTSLLASITAAIGEEIIFRLFFISFWYWLIGYLILKKKYLKLVYIFVALLSAVAFTVSHLPSIMMLLGVEKIADINNIMILELFILNGSLSLFAAYYFKKVGYFGAVMIHLWVDIVWHVIWGLI